MENYTVPTRDEMPVATRALHAMALVLILLAICRLASQACFYVDCRLAGAEVSLDMAPTLGLAAVIAVFVWLGGVIQKRADLS